MLLHGHELIPPYLAPFKFGTLPALDSFLCLANISETSKVSHLSICLTFALIVHFVIERICEKNLTDCLPETFKTCTGLVFVEPDGEVVHGPSGGMLSKVDEFVPFQRRPEIPIFL